MLDGRTILRKQITSLVAGLCVIASCTASAGKEVKVLNWYGYIANDTVANFEKETGIKVIYDITDSWETSEAKLLSGNSGYDVMFMGSTYALRQIPAGVWLKLDKSKLPNWSGIDPAVLKSMAEFDPGNQYLQPWSWYGEVVAYNVSEFKKRFPQGADSWGVLLEPDNAKKLSECGLIWTDAYDDLFVPELLYNGFNPYSENEKDYEVAYEKAKLIRPYIKLFSNSYYNNLADGEHCASAGWSGDVGSMVTKEGITLGQFVPKEGTYIDYEGLGVVVDSKNVDEAYAFLNFVLKPSEAIAFTRDIKYPNPVLSTFPAVQKEVIAQGIFYPSALPKELQNKLYPYHAKENKKIERLKTRLFTKFKTEV